jgi:hypothetical protein
MTLNFVALVANKTLFSVFRLRRDALVPAQNIGPGQGAARPHVRLGPGRRSPGECLWRSNDANISSTDLQTCVFLAACLRLLPFSLHKSLNITADE